MDIWKEFLENAYKLAVLKAEKESIPASTPQQIYIIEESDELIRVLSDYIKLVCKEQRGHDIKDAFVEEAGDVLATLFTYLYISNIDPENVVRSASTHLQRGISICSNPESHNLNEY